MGIDNEQKLQTVIDEAKLSRLGSLNKHEMIQIILDFQDSLGLTQSSNSISNGQEMAINLAIMAKLIRSKTTSKIKVKMEKKKEKVMKKESLST